MIRARLAALAAFILLLAAGIVWAAKEPDPGSREDPLVSKSYVDNASRWTRLQAARGDVVRIAEGTEIVVVFSPAPGIAVEADPDKLGKIIDLTAGSPLGATPLSANHHYISTASDEFTIKLGADAQLMVRNGG